MSTRAILNDVIFKIVFGQDHCEALLQKLLNALLELEGADRIDALVIRNPQLDRTTLTDKGVILDVKARDGVGRLYNIEVQTTHQPHFVKRSLLYLSLLFSGQIGSGGAYNSLQRTVGIALLDFKMFADHDDPMSIFRMHDVRHGKTLTDVLEMRYIELGKAKKEAVDALRTPFERWIHVLKYAEVYETGDEPLPPALLEEDGIAMAIDKMREARSDDEVRMLIEEREKAILDQQWRIDNWIEAARQEGRQTGLEEGRQTGLEEGRQTGLEEGRQTGLEEGRREACLEIARQMREAGADPELIEKVTGVRVDSE